MELFGYKEEVLTWKYQPKTKNELIELVNNNDILLSDIDTSLITDMSKLFYYSKRKSFEGIETWNVSNVTDMNSMFESSKFNINISNWDTSKVRNMKFMFRNTPFDQPIGNWDVSSVESLSFMFYGSHFNKDISEWNVSNAIDLIYMFSHSDFNQDISNWNLKNSISIRNMFSDSDYSNENILDWVIPKTVDTVEMFINTTLEKNNNLPIWYEKN